MKTYQSKLISQAIKCTHDALQTARNSQDYRETDCLVIKGIDGEEYGVPDKIFSSGLPNDDFYLTFHKNGHKAWCPADIFEANHAEVPRYLAADDDTTDVRGHHGKWVKSTQISPVDGGYLLYLPQNKVKSGQEYQQEVCASQFPENVREALSVLDKLLRD